MTSREEFDEYVRNYRISSSWDVWQAAYLAGQRSMLEAEPVWIQPDHLAKAMVAPFMCRVEPTKRIPHFVAMYRLKDVP